MRQWLAGPVEAFRAAERWLLPGHCLVCHERVGQTADDSLVCGMCRNRWPRLPFPQCPRCGQPTDADTECRICSDWPAGLSGVRSAVWMDPSVRRTVHLLKYDGWHRIAAAMAEPVAALIPTGGSGVLVPIPLGGARHQLRGYNQSAKLAQAIGGKASRVVSETTLVRSRETRTQTTLTPEEREANLRNAFRVVGAVPESAVLVDDVFTTGATLVSAARTLLEAGTITVTAVSFARAELPLTGASRAT